MNITQAGCQRDQNSTAFGAKLKIEYLDNIGEKITDCGKKVIGRQKAPSYHELINPTPSKMHSKGRRNTSIKRLSQDEVAKLEKLAAQKGVDSDRINFKINNNTDEYIVGEAQDMGARMPIKEEKQGIKAITDINNDLDCMDLSRKNNIFNNGHKIAETSPFEVLKSYLESILGINK